MLSPQGLQIRAALFRFVRTFFHKQGFLEVDTPIRQPLLIPESNIVPLAAEGQYLQTSPELCMKRLLAAGCDRIFQICPCFRKGEQGRRHLEEFTMLEWYRKDGDYRQLMEDCEALLGDVVAGMAQILPSDHPGRTSGLLATVDVAKGFERLSVEQAFAAYSPVSLADALARGQFDELLVEHVEPHLGWQRPLFLYDYPAELASLARIDPERPAVAERFELYIQGMELANGFSELTDPFEQRARFIEEMETIRRNKTHTVAMPERFLADLQQLDHAAGIAFGLDRLLMLLMAKKEIAEVVSFNLLDLLSEGDGP